MSSDKKDIRQGKMLQAFRDGLSFNEASRRVGVTTRTLYRWCEADADLREAVEEARCKADDDVESATFANCVDPDAAHNTLRMFWLKSRRPEVYREKSEHTVNGTVPIAVHVVEVVKPANADSPDDDDETP